MKLKPKHLKELGYYLAAVRTEAELIQKDMAKALDLTSNQYISNIEQGKCPPSVEYLRALQRLAKPNKNEFLTFIQQLHVDAIREALK